MTKKRMVLEIGMGTDIRGADPTKAACRALRDALWHNSLSIAAALGQAPEAMLVLPDDIVAHPLHTSIDIASLCPNAEITVFPWKEPPELKARTINRARMFLKRHQTA